MYSYGNNTQARAAQRNGEDGVGSIGGLLEDESGGDSNSILSSLMDKGRTPMALIQVCIGYIVLLVIYELMHRMDVDSYTIYLFNYYFVSFDSDFHLLFIAFGCIGGFPVYPVCPIFEQPLVGSSRRARQRRHGGRPAGATWVHAATEPKRRRRQHSGPRDAAAVCVVVYRSAERGRASSARRAQRLSVRESTTKSTWSKPAAECASSFGKCAAHRSQHGSARRRLPGQLGPDAVCTS